MRLRKLRRSTVGDFGSLARSLMGLFLLEAAADAKVEGR
jgi:hypothetical protein